MRNAPPNGGGWDWRGGTTPPLRGGVFSCKASHHDHTAPFLSRDLIAMISLINSPVGRVLDEVTST
jgi:hypothetical protein